MSDGDDDDDEPELIKPTKRRPRYRELSTDEEDEEDEEDGEEGKSPEGEEEEEEEEEDGEPIKHYSESDMGQKGEPFTEGDLYMAAKHAAKYSAWNEMTSKDRWEPFADRVRALDSDYRPVVLNYVQFQQRSAKSWAEYYRRNEDGTFPALCGNFAPSDTFHFSHPETPQKDTQRDGERDSSRTMCTTKSTTWETQIFET